MAAMPTALRKSVDALDRLLDETADERRLLGEGHNIMADLVAADSWLDERYRRPRLEQYTQYLLYADPENRFTISSFVWAGGQSTPIHDHRIWGIVGVLRGAEMIQPYRFDAGGAPVADGKASRLVQGEVSIISPVMGDVHSVSNALTDEVTVSIHIYGNDICAVDRSVFHPDGRRSAFRSSYANAIDTPAFDR